MSADDITAGCLARWKAIHDARSIDLRVKLHEEGIHLKRLRRHSPEWMTEFAKASWLDHLIPVGHGYATFRALVRADLLLLLIPLVGPVQAPAVVDKLVPANPPLFA